MILAERFDAFLLDLDGVVWRGEAPVDGAHETIEELRSRGKRVVFVTNNSSRTPREYAIKLMRLKVPTQIGDIVTSGHALVDELRRIGLGEGDRVHVFGGEGLFRLLAAERFVPVRETHDVRALVVGWNRRAAYDDIRDAATLARSGMPFIASNADATYPAEAELLPGTGALLAAIETAAGREATVVGKPRPDVFRIALDRAGVPADRALFCGDRPETDVVGARAAGIPCALVLSGVTQEATLGDASDVPDVVLDDISDVLRDVPSVAVERRKDTLVALDGEDGGKELAWLRSTAKDGAVSLSDLQVDGAVDQQRGWLVVRRLLVEAVSGAREVEASADVRPFLERIGVSRLVGGDDQPRLFTG